MDTFNNDYNNVEAEEGNAIALARDNDRVRSMGKAFRTIELCIALFFLLWMLLRLPFAIKIFAELLRQLVFLLLTPLSILLLFGVTVTAVMVNSYKVSTQNISDQENVGINFCQNIINVGDLQETVEFHFRHHQLEVEAPYGFEVENTPRLSEEQQVDEETTTVYEDKEMISCGRDRAVRTPTTATFEDDVADDVEMDADSDPEPEVVNQTEAVTVMEKSITMPDGDDVVLQMKQRCSSPRDHLNDADFKKTIDAFIKRQHEFLKLENRCDYSAEKRTCINCT